jgi:2-oxoisovalerate dehydrogenase E2 component (dihydrolipoyl transacylase)
VKPGDKVEEFSKICEVQSDKAAVEISSRYEGTVKKLYHEIGAIAKVGTPLCDIDTPDNVQDGSAIESTSVSQPEPVAQITASSKPSQEVAIEVGNDELTFATPAVRRIAKEHNVNLKLVVATGPRGRVLKGDILQYVETLKTGISNHPVSTISPVVGDKTVPLSPIQKAMFKSMTKSLSIPHFGFSDEVIVNRTSQLRNEINSYLKTIPKGTYPFEKISYMPIFLKALSEALKQYPILNSKVMNADTTPALLFRVSHNIGIAMDTPQGYHKLT